MQKINSAKIQFAAHFIANQLDIYFLESSHGEHSKLFIKFVSKRITKDSDINQWMNREGRIYPRWESKNNPWEVLSYIGPVKNQQEDSLYSSIIAVSNKKEKASHVIQKTLNLYRLCDLGIKERSALQSILNICLEEAQLNCFTDGINHRSSENILTLSSAQHLADKVRNSDQITTNDLELIKVLLTKAPLEFGQVPSVAMNRAKSSLKMATSTCHGVPHHAMRPRMECLTRSSNPVLWAVISQRVSQQRQTWVDMQSPQAK